MSDDDQKMGPEEEVIESKRRRRNDEKKRRKQKKKRERRRKTYRSRRCSLVKKGLEKRFSCDDVSDFPSFTTTTLRQIRTTT